MSRALVEREGFVSVLERNRIVRAEFGEQPESVLGVFSLGTSFCFLRWQTHFVTMSLTFHK